MPNWAKINLLRRGIRASLGGEEEAGFAPGDIEGLSLHLDATVASSITEDGAGVSAWVDQSSNGNDVVQTNDLKKPITATIGGLTVITFDRGAEVLQLVASSVTGLEGPNITVFAVINKRYDEGGIYNGIICRQAANWAAGWRMAPDNSSVNMDWAVNGYTREAKIVDFTDADTGADEFHVYTANHDSSIDTSIGYVNNVETQQNTAATTDLSAGSYHLDIGNGSPDHSRGLFGSLGELIVYESVLGADDRTTVYDYLAAKWPIAAIA